MVSHGGCPGEKPLVLDADGLNLLAQHPEWKQYLTSRVVMTPHMGEMGRLTGKKVSELQKDRIAAARELAAETGAVCVLKDACTVTAAPDGNTWISLAGNPGMATAGSGDVLTGILVGVLAMFLNKRTELPDTGRQLRWEYCFMVWQEIWQRKKKEQQV